MEGKETNLHISEAGINEFMSFLLENILKNYSIIKIFVNWDSV